MQTTPTTLWVFKFKNVHTGQDSYTEPVPLSELLEVVNRLKVPGEFCYCVIIPDFKAEVELKLDVNSSKLFKDNPPVLDYAKIEEEAKANVRTNSEISPRRRRRAVKTKEVAVVPERDETEQ